MQDTTPATKQYQCRHIFTDGRRCASPCLRHQEFCYYHHTTRKPIANPRQRRSRRSTFHLPLPEDRSAIQSSIGEILQRIASNDIDPRRAGLLLYGLQIASLNLPKTQPVAKTAPEPQTVEEITIDPALGVLAPRAEVGQNKKRKSPVALLLERMMQEDEKEKTASSEPAIVPTLHATAHCPKTLPVILQSSAIRSHERSSRKGCDLPKSLPGSYRLWPPSGFLRVYSQKTLPCLPGQHQRRLRPQASLWRTLSEVVETMVHFQTK
jgi:hypothetical protein